MSTLSRGGCTIAIALLAACIGCGGLVGQTRPNESAAPVDPERFELLARIAHISDAQIVDEESPARLTFASDLTRSAWRPYEAFSTQLLDGMIRTINKMHVARGTFDFVIHTGDATDNVQLNELRWFITALDGGEIDPLTGVDDRDEASRPDPLLDPHHAFVAQGLYRNGLHGDQPTIPWYAVFGNHDRFAVGVLPIVTNALGRRVGPVPLEDYIGLVLPPVLDPTGFLTWSPITPANPGPPPVLNLPMLLSANADRRYVTAREFIDAHLGSVTNPPGHGFDANRPDRTWYSAAPVPGLRLIALDSATPFVQQPTLPYPEGAISFPQLLFLQRELAKAQEAGECVIVATHHPSESLEALYGTALTTRGFVALLNRYPCVKLHLAGHWHTNGVIDRGGYLEIITGSILDPPQQGRVIEIWRERTPEPRALPRANMPSDPEPRASARAGLRAPNKVPPAGPNRKRQRPVPNPALALGARKVGEGPLMQQDGRPPAVEIRYRMFSHLDEIAAPDGAQTDLFDDPLLPLRRIAADLAAGRTD